MYADKTRLLSFGTEKGYPVLARCANLPITIHNGTGVGGGRLVGWLPIVHFFFSYSVNNLADKKYLINVA